MPMNLLLWALQIILAVKFVSVSYTHGARPDPAKMQKGMQRFGEVARPLLIAIAVCMLLGAIALVLPAATGVATWLTPWSAALLALMMLAAIGFHVICREQADDRGRFDSGRLAAMVAYGRWVIVPL